MKVRIFPDAPWKSTFDTPGSILNPGLPWYVWDNWGRERAKFRLSGKGHRVHRNVRQELKGELRGRLGKALDSSPRQKIDVCLKLADALPE